MQETEKRGGTPAIYTDLACESGRAAEVEEETVTVGGAPITISRRREEDGGRSVTLGLGRITDRGEGDLPVLASLLSRELSRMAREMLGRTLDALTRVLVVGLGNADMTPDAIGPGTVRRLTVTRHLRDYDEGLFAALGCCELSALSPGVLGQTGMESGELVKSAVSLVRPDLLVAVDALAARSCDRLSSTVQLSDGGISPGAGIGNRRMAIDAATMGCPVLALGVPTVVDSATLVLDALERAGMVSDPLPEALSEVLSDGRSFIVSPRDCDRMVDLTCMLLSRAIDISFGIKDI